MNKQTLDQYILDSYDRWILISGLRPGLTDIKTFKAGVIAGIQLSISMGEEETKSEETREVVK